MINYNFVNEEERQVGIVKDMVFTIPVLIETLTKSMTLVEEILLQLERLGWYWF